MQQYPIYRISAYLIAFFLLFLAVNPISTAAWPGALASENPGNRAGLETNGEKFSIAAILPGTGQDLAWGDVDNDGDLDLAAAEGEAHIYLNQGGNFMTQADWTANGSSDAAGAAWGDVNNDGALDLAVGESTGAKHLYLNVGGVLQSNPVWTTSGSTTHRLAWCDFNGDGWLDLAATDTAPLVYISISGTLPLTPNWTGGVADTATMDIACGDFDADSDLDLVTAGSDQGINVYRNAEGVLQATPVWSHIPINSGGIPMPALSVDLGDVDGNGLLDMVVAGNQIQLNLNSGGMIFTPVSIIDWFTFSVPWGHNARWGDADNDGGLDLAVTTQACGWSCPSPDQVLKLEGSGPGIWQSTVLFDDQRASDSHSAAWGDWDGDGDLDLAIGAQEGIWLYRNNAINFDFSAPWATLQTRGFQDPGHDFSHVAWGDVNGDGWLDLAGSDGVYLATGDGLQATPLWSVPYVGGSSSSFAWGDVNGDGRLDLAVGYTYGDARVFLNITGTLSTTPVFISDPGSVTSLAWGDVDGDGDLDLAVGFLDSLNRVYRNNGGTLQPEPMWEAALSEPTNDLAWGDVDGDGDLDLAVGNGLSPSTGRAVPNRLYLNQMGQLQTTPAWSGNNYDNTISLAWGDINSDGRPDLVTGSYNTPSRLYLNDGGMLSDSAAWNSEEFGPTTDIALGDVDGDGDLDLVQSQSVPFDDLGNNYGYLQTYINDHGQWPVASNAQSVNQLYALSVSLADINGDGSLDLGVGYRQPTIFPPTAIFKVYANHHAASHPRFGQTASSASIALESDAAPTFNLPTTSLAPADFYAVPQIRSGVIPITYTLYDQASQPVRLVRAFYSLDGGGLWFPAIPTANTETTNLATAPKTSGAISMISTPMLAIGDGQVVSSTLSQDRIGWIDQINSLELNITHAQDSQLSAALHADWPAPNGTNILLFNGVGGNATGFDITLSDDPWYSPIDSATAPYTTYEPVYPSLDVPKTISGAITSSLTITNGPTVITDVNVRALDGIYRHSAVLTYTLSSPSSGSLPLASFACNNGGLVFPGYFSSMYVDPFADPAAELTLELWIKPDAISDQKLIGKANGGSNGYVLGIENSQLYPEVWDTNGVRYTAKWGTIPIGEWTHVALVWQSGGDMIGYINGVEVGRVAASANLISPGSSAFRVGAAPWDASFAFDGALDDVRVWFTARSGAEIQAAMNQRLTGSEADLEAYWPLDEGTGSWVTDRTSHHYEGIFGDHATWGNVIRFDLDDEAGAPLGGCPSQDGVYQPLVPLSAFDGQDSNGNWTLMVSSTNEAILSGWELNFSEVITTYYPIVGEYQPMQPLAALQGIPLTTTLTLIITDSVAGGTGIFEGWSVNINGLYPIPTHRFEWDTFASGFFGQSDNVVFRIEAFPGQAGLNGAPGPYQRPFVSAQTFPFRVRGTQVQVLWNSQPVENAIVYRLPAGQSSGAQPISDSAGQPYLTDAFGYLQGRGEIQIGDQLVAMLPITTTESYALYNTSASPTEIGLAGHIVQNPGVQTLSISADNSLMLFNLDLSLEWDARNDGSFLENLDLAVQQASAVLYDVSNGQIALGEVRVHQAKENWIASDVVIYAQNGIRPRASMGGVSNQLINDVISPTLTITDAYGPGQVRMGPNWDPFGLSLIELDQDWQRALAHELSHYLLYLPDNYLGVSPDGLPITTDCQGSFMTNTYDDLYSEFLTSAGWVGDCMLTIAQHTTRRTDWETVAHFYDSLASPGLTNPGPGVLPLQVTHLTLVEPTLPDDTLPSNFFDVRDAQTMELLSLRGAQAYLFKPTFMNGNTLLRDETLISLGSTVGDGDRIKVRGAEPGDRLCIFGEADPDDASSYAGCIEALTAQDRSILLDTVTGWQPDIMVQSVTSRTLAITVTLPISVSVLNVQVFPAYGPITSTLPVLSPAAAMLPLDPANPTTFTQIITLEYPAFEGFVRVWVPGSAPVREAVTQVFFNPPWGPNRKPFSGGNNRAWGANTRQLGAPVASGDGQVTIFNLKDIFADTGVVSLQALNDLPSLPGWLHQVGQGYRYDGNRYFPRSISFEYLQRDVPAGYEYSLRIYYLPSGGQIWQRLDTDLNQLENRATAIMPDDAVDGDGIYALVATIEKLPLRVGWNLFGYPLPGTNQVGSALASLGDAYTSVAYFAPGADQWRLYDQLVLSQHPDYAALVNDLSVLEFDHVYWIYATEPVTPYLGVPEGLMAIEAAKWPPATFYGPVSASPVFTPTVGMEVIASINGVICGRGVVISLDRNSQLAYRVQIKPDTGDGCGNPGRKVIFTVGGRVMLESYWLNSDDTWNRQAWYFPLNTPSFYLYLPVVGK